MKDIGKSFGELVTILFINSFSILCFGWPKDESFDPASAGTNRISIFHSCIKNRFILVELPKKNINVALNGDQFGDENIIVDDSPFKSTLIYVNSEGVSVDLLQLYGAQTHMDRYVTLVMDKLFTFEEITTITKEELSLLKYGSI
ncbi:unnamed protein product [Adineta steineri]|uniref:Uncharacterized protein n=1 Tax=Adineta steineri TaxID=433720 RepID=A0A814UIT0_9BILA|nr:unnamed protein product [Adineta steineri]CAF1174664.1 unnamed protein product [Adineta steineri]